MWLTRQPREVIGASASLEIPAGKLRRRRRAAARDRQARARRGDRQARLWLGGVARRSTPAPGSATSACGCTSRPGCRTAPRSRATRTSASRSCRGRSPGSTTRSRQCEDSKTLIALFWLRGAACRRVRDRRAVVSVHQQAARGFQQGAAAYERGRPGYPRDAVQWLWRELRLGPGAPSSTSAPAPASSRASWSRAERPSLRSSRSRRCAPCSSRSCPRPGRWPAPLRRCRWKTRASTRSSSPRRFTGSTSRRPRRSSTVCSGRMAGSG